MDAKDAMTTAKALRFVKASRTLHDRTPDWLMADLIEYGRARRALDIRNDDLVWAFVYG